AVRVAAARRHLAQDPHERAACGDVASEQGGAEEVLQRDRAGVAEGPQVGRLAAGDRPGIGPRPLDDLIDLGLPDRGMTAGIRRGPQRSLALPTEIAVALDVDDMAAMMRPQLELEVAAELEAGREAADPG